MVYLISHNPYSSLDRPIKHCYTESAKEFKFFNSLVIKP